MKRTLITTFFICFIIISFAQNSSLYLTTNKTTSLIFPFAVKYIDRGSPDILVQQVKEADNIVLVKAATAQLAETNLTVITSEGAVYAFRVNYEEDPYTLVWELPAQHGANVATYAHTILDNPRTVRGIHDGAFDIFASVTGIYIRDETIYYQLQLYNRSTIDYDIDQIRFSIRDRKKAKRTATQEIELMPQYVAGNTKRVKANNNNSIIVALPKFTLADRKYLSIRIAEKNGGRNLSMRVHNRSIIRATPLPDFK